jgi:hypothetical protein
VVPDISKEGSGSKTFGEEGDTLLRNVENNEATKHRAPEDDIPPLHHCENKLKKKLAAILSLPAGGYVTQDLQYPVM